MSTKLEELKIKIDEMLLTISNLIGTKLDGNAAAVSADKLTSPFDLIIDGDGSATTTLDGSANATLTLTLNDSPLAPGVYSKVQTDSKGRIIGSALLVASDIPDLDASKIKTGVFDAARIPILNQNTTGNATTASRLESPFGFQLSGDVLVNGMLDGSSTVNFNASLSNTGVGAGEYGDAANIPRFTVDSKGRITEVTLVPVDIPAKTAIPVKEFVQLQQDTVTTYDLQTLLGANYADYDLDSAEITVLVKDTNGSSPTYDAYTNSESMVVYGIKDSRYVVVSNQGTGDLAAYVKVLVHPNAA